MEKGSVLILTIITVLIFSIMVAGLLTIGTTEIKTTQNYLLKKKSFYHAIQGLETVIEQARHVDDPTTITVSKVSSPPLESDGTRKNFYTGNMKDGESKCHVILTNSMLRNWLACLWEPNPVLSRLCIGCRLFPRFLSAAKLPPVPRSRPEFMLC